ncbi:MAG: GTP-binding protein [Candidatus Lokiarchaeota archaeon]|nr:GTP-binding protein [Candidatus Lokiarchaeota archaeon]
MIYEIYILYRENKVQLYQYSLKKMPIENPKLVSGFMAALTNFASEIGEQIIESLTFKTLKFVYGYFGDIFIVLIVDKEDDEQIIKSKIRAVGEAFLLKFGNILENWDGNAEKFNDFNDIIVSVIKSVLKIVLLGPPGVGKTTISKLLKGETIPIEHIPTIGAGISELLISGEVQLMVWDMAGQDRFRPIWENFISGADIIFLVSDSTQESLNQAKEIYDIYKDKVDENCNFYAIANKQDLDGALSPLNVGEILNVKAFGLVAIDPDNREKLQTVLKSVIQEKIGIKLLEIEKEIIDGREQLAEIIEEIKAFKAQLIRLLNDYSNPIFRSINYWIDKLDYYPFEDLTQEDGEEFKNQMEKWKLKAKELVSDIVNHEVEFNCPWCGSPIDSKSEKKCPQCLKNFRICSLCESVIVKDFEDYSQCYYCKEIFHTEHLKNYINYRKKCPNCRHVLDPKFDIIPKSRVKNF